MTKSNTESPASWHRGYAPFDTTEWRALEPDCGPFVDLRFLASLETTGCVGASSGWQPAPVAISADDQPTVLAPLWLKSHSHGEFVFDWAWARAAHSAGIAWYPKLLVAAPYSPVTGPRLLGAGAHTEAAGQLIEAIEHRVVSRRLSSAGVNFCNDTDAALLRQAGWLERFDWQFHWHNPGYRDFDDFLSRLRSKARKNIRAERRRVKRDGWNFRWVDGASITPRLLDLVDACYQTTFNAYGNLPSLNREMFAACARRFGKQFLVCVASQEDRDQAVAVFFRDRERLYGRYWGSLKDTRDVHFECCYYQGISYCIDQGLTWFEPGAQGEHKIRRGFLPVRTISFHFIAHPGMRHAVARYLRAEAVALNDYRRQLDRLDPYADVSD